jgi:hypothetical protein
MKGNHQVYSYQTVLENYIAMREKVTLVLRNIGPRNIADDTRKIEVYDTYKMILDRDVMAGLLNHEIIFVEFDTLEEAEEYARNFPKNPDESPDFYVLAEVYNFNGCIEYHNR